MMIPNFDGLLSGIFFMGLAVGLLIAGIIYIIPSITITIGG